MPCRSDYMEETARRVLALLDEIETGTLDRAAYSKDYGRGYNNRANLDELTAKLCAACHKMGPYNMTARSQELQAWWNRHKETDIAREEAERIAADTPAGELTEAQKALLRRFNII